MTIKAGTKIPAASLKTMSAEGMQTITTDELFKGKKVVLFALPGAFTPTCSAKHLPSFVQLADKIRAKGVDTIACLSVNDAFVMDAWGKNQNVGDKVTMLADGNGDFTKARLMLTAYGNARPVSAAEIDALPLLARGSALRFLLTRLYDWLNHPEGALLKPKDPLEYLHRLRFHAGVRGPGAYGLG